jgi:hypothetical protein
MQSAFTALAGNRGWFPNSYFVSDGAAALKHYRKHHARIAH